MVVDLINEEKKWYSPNLFILDVLLQTKITLRETKSNDGQKAKTQ